MTGTCVVRSGSGQLQCFGLLCCVWLVCSGAAAAARYDAVVGRPANKGETRYPTIAAALEAAPATGERPFRIFIGPGNYYEKLVVSRPNVALIGSGQERSRIYHDTYAGRPRTDGRGTWGTGESGTLIIRAPGFSAQDLRIENSFDYPANEVLPESDGARTSNAQAVAVMTDRGSDRALFDRVTITGYQDTLYTQAGRSLFRNSFISGHVDFIFGAGTAVFVDSDIVARPRQKTLRPLGYVTAPSTRFDSPYGLVFIHCRLLREPGVADASLSLGRPWHPTKSHADGRYSDPGAIGQTVFIDTWMDGHIMAQAWQSMGGTLVDGRRTQFQPEDARFFEYRSTGPGATINRNRRQLSPVQAQTFSLDHIFGDWSPPPSIPATGPKP